MWSQQYTQSQLRFPHEALEPALLDEKAVEKKNVKKKDVKKKVSEAKKDDKVVAEVEAKAIVVAVGEDSKTSKESDSTAAAAAAETSVPVVGDEPVLVKTNDTKDDNNDVGLSDKREMKEVDDGEKSKKKSKCTVQ